MFSTTAKTFLFNLVMIFLGFVIGATAVIKYHHYKVSRVNNISYITKIETQLKAQRQLTDELDTIIYDMKQQKLRHLEEMKAKKTASVKK